MYYIVDSQKNVIVIDGKVLWVRGLFRMNF